MTNRFLPPGIDPSGDIKIVPPENISSDISKLHLKYGLNRYIHVAYIQVLTDRKRVLSPEFWPLGW
jgi:hypothetical protein